MDGGFYVGRFDNYPEFTTHGESLEDFKAALREIMDG
jgi:predicted RNase H-like HicB family nuclease